MLFCRAARYGKALGFVMNLVGLLRPHVKVVFQRVELLR
jgi:hypothetical protein